MAKRAANHFIGAVLAAALALAGCSGPHPGATTAPAANTGADLVSVLASTSTPEESRKAADQRLVLAKGKTDETRLSVLEQIIFAPGHSDSMRIYAMDQLASADPARAGKTLVMYLPRMEGPVLEHACALAVKLGDVRILEPLVISLARAVEEDGTGLDKRAEVAAIEELSGKRLDDVLLDELHTSHNESARVAALDILRIRLGDEVLTARLTTIKGADDFLRELQFFVTDFQTIPRGANEVAWARQLERNPILKSAAKERHNLFKGEGGGDYLFAPRFASVLAYADDAGTQLTRSELLADIKQRLAAKEHVRREPEYKNSPDDIDESLPANEKKLSRADLLAIRMILRSLQDPAILAELYRQGMEDMTDTSSEHGGLLLVRAGKIDPRPYPGMYAENDFQYITGDALVRDTLLGAAQYHFHFQQVHNSERAGPGAGDLAYVKHARCNAVVITSVGTRKMNLDYYTPAGALLDLGIWETK